jgi:hypothetical protein
MKPPFPCFDHLASLSDDVGIFEHADGRTPRWEHGYCTDDNARLLVVACREPTPSPVVRDLASTALHFLSEAQSVDGRCHNRLSTTRRWQDRPGLDDCWGRSLWGLGTAFARSPVDAISEEALVRFERAALKRSTWPHAMAFAGLGAAEVLTKQPSHTQARDLLLDAVSVAGQREHAASWRWPQARLTYANAVLPEVMIAAGLAFGRSELLSDGLDLLAWLLDQETGDGHLSVTPAGGRSPGDPRPAFDQQPIEVAALADACARAAVATGEARWIQGLAAAVAWFLGDNDSNTVMFDDRTGGGFDGLTPSGANLNQGAESTLAAVSTLQHARTLASVGS